MLTLVCLSLVASALALPQTQFPVPAVSTQANCRAQCMLLPPAQKRDCIELCGADAGKPSWIPSFLDDIEWRNFDGKTDNIWFPSGAEVVDQVPSMWETSQSTEECANQCVTLPYPYSIECAAQCPRINDFAAGGYGLPAVNGPYPTGRIYVNPFIISSSCYQKCMETIGNNGLYAHPSTCIFKCK